MSDCFVLQLALLNNIETYVDIIWNAILHTRYRNPSEPKNLTTGATENWRWSGVRLIVPINIIQRINKNVKKLEALNNLGNNLKFVEQFHSSNVKHFVSMQRWYALGNTDSPPSLSCILK